MSDLPRQTLTHIIAKYGRSVCENPKRCEALLRDLCGAHRRAINILIGALEERVPFDLMNAGKTLPREVMLARLSKRLQDQLAYTEDAARWAVDSWALALGVISSSEAEARAILAAQSKQKELQPPSRSEAPPNTPPPNNLGSSAVPTTRPAAAATPKPPPPKPSSSRQPPVSKHSTASTSRPATPPTFSNIANQPTTASTRIQKKTTQPSTTTPLSTSPQSNSQPSISSRPIAPAPRRGIGKLRGCLIALILIGGLATLAVFAIPAIVAALRREQLQPSINEPRIPVSSAPVAEPIKSPILVRPPVSAIRQIDFANFTYEGDPVFNRGKNFTLRNGRYAGSVDSALMNLIAVTYGDVTGDKIEEATVSLRANFARDTAQINYIYTISNGGPKLLRMFKGDVR